jgi:hypothetical protein
MSGTDPREASEAKKDTMKDAISRVPHPLYHSERSAAESKACPERSRREPASCNFLSKGWDTTTFNQNCSLEGQNMVLIGGSCGSPGDVFITSGKGLEAAA